MEDLLSRVLDSHGGLDRWAGARTITAHLSIGGPIWAAKGWAGALADQTLTVDTRRERSVFTPFTAPGLRSVFEVEPERVTIETTDGEVVQQRAHPRDAFTGFLRATPWDRHEIQPWQEAGQQWRRLRVRFPETIATHSPEQVFYYDADGMQRRMDYVTEILGSTLVAHYCGHPKAVDGLVFPTRRRVFRRNPDGTSNLNMPSITIDIDDITIS